MGLNFVKYYHKCFPVSKFSLGRKAIFIASKTVRRDYNNFDILANLKSAHKKIFIVIHSHFVCKSYLSKLACQL